jgi:hypothetical protein
MNKRKQANRRHSRQNQLNVKEITIKSGVKNFFSSSSSIIT